MKSLPVISDAFAVGNAQQLLKAGEQLVLDAAAYKQYCSGGGSGAQKWAAGATLLSLGKCRRLTKEEHVQAQPLASSTVSARSEVEVGPF